VSRYLVLFAREPARQAREKGFAFRDAAALFAGFAAGWREAARLAGARLVVATPAEDRPAWRRVLLDDGSDEPLWIEQEGRSFGERLEHAARRVAGWGGRAILVGGDVAPSAECLIAAFESVEGGADGAISPAPDGGVSLLGLGAPDLDLLRTIAPRRRNVHALLAAALERRGRRIAVLGVAADVDGRRHLRSLLRERWLAPELASLAGRVLLDEAASPADPSIPWSVRSGFAASPSPRGPPAAA